MASKQENYNENVVMISIENTIKILGVKKERGEEYVY